MDHDTMNTIRTAPWGSRELLDAIEAAHSFDLDDDVAAILDERAEVDWLFRAWREIESESAEVETAEACLDVSRRLSRGFDARQPNAGERTNPKVKGGD